MKFTQKDVGSLLQISTAGKKAGMGATRRKPFGDVAVLIGFSKTDRTLINVRRRTCSTVERYHQTFWDRKGE